MFENNEELAVYQEWSDDRLYESLGDTLLGGGIGAAPEDPDHAKRFARWWFNERLSEMTRSVCNDPAVRALIRDPHGGRLVEAATVADALMTLYDHPALTIIATLFVRMGLTTLCGSADRE